MLLCVIPDLTRNLLLRGIQFTDEVNERTHSGRGTGKELIRIVWSKDISPRNPSTDGDTILTEAKQNQLA